MVTFVTLQMCREIKKVRYYLSFIRRLRLWHGVLWLDVLSI